MSKMALHKHRDWILDTIDQLRQRKARPDFRRISHMLQRKHGLKPSETQESLEKLVEAEIILKVDYKGSISYRSAAKWHHCHLGGHVINSSTSSTRILNAIQELTKDGYRKSASANEIEEWLISKYPDTRLVKNRLYSALQRECNSKIIKPLEDGSFALIDNSFSNVLPEKNESATLSEPVTENPVASSSKSQGGSHSATKRARPPSKRKRIKKTHGPDFETPQVKSGEDSKCDYCLLSAESNKDGKPEGVLSCKDCNAKAHPSCMDYSEELAKRALNSPWQCIDCKTCYVCNDAEDAVSMLFCDSCDKGYHMTCHNPPVTDKPTGKWDCSVCSREKSGASDAGQHLLVSHGKLKKAMKTSAQTSAAKVDTEDQAEDTEDEEEEDEDVSPGLMKGIRKRRRSKKQKAIQVKKRRYSSQPSVSSQGGTVHTPSVEDFPINGFSDNIGGASCLPTPSASPTPEDIEDSDTVPKPSPLTSETNQDIYLDASTWTISDVVRYFENCGYKEQAEAFKNQEIDGQSLLLMKRSDVLTGLDIKLGPALKIYQKVMKLQTAEDVLAPDGCMS